MLKINANIHNPARYSVELLYNKTRTLNLINKLQNEYTCTNLPFERQPIKSVIWTVINDIIKEGKIALNTKKQSL